MFKVKAILDGYYNHVLVSVGKVFYIKHAKEFSSNWMKSLDSKLDAAMGQKPAAKSPKKALPPEPVEEPEQEEEMPLDESEPEPSESDENEVI